MSFPLVADRFRALEKIYEDPGFSLWLAEDLERGGRVLVQACGGIALGEDVAWARQLEALLAWEEARQQEPSEWFRYGEQGLLVRRYPEGKSFFSVSETQRDEVYLRWLRQALEALAACHDAGFWHLAQHPGSWCLASATEGEERLELRDLPLVANLPLGMRAHPENVAALAPEFFQNTPLDARCDLYALACLILRQRHPKAFERVHSLGAWLDLHRGGRIAALVPKTPSPLNDLLRRMLQADPAARPADARAALREIPGAPVPASPGKALPDWAPERALHRQATLYFRIAYDLLRSGDARARELIAECPAALASAYPATALFLRSELAWREGETEAFRGLREAWSADLAGASDPRLVAALALADSQRAAFSGDAAAREAAWSSGWAALAAFPDEEWEAEFLLERARAALSSREDAAALADLSRAWGLLRGAEDALAVEPVGLALAELLGCYGRAAEAWDVLQQLLMRKEAKDPIAIELAAALAATRQGEFDRAREFFSRAKSRISAQKDLPRLVWAGLHELRLFLAQGDFAAAARELKVLKNRARGLAPLRELLEMSELATGLGAGSGVVATPYLEERLTAVAAGAAPFRELFWSPAETCEWLGRAARYWGREEEAARLEARARAFREATAAIPRETLPAALPTAREAENIPVSRAELPLARSPAPAPPSLPPPQPGGEGLEGLRRLQAENRALKERVKRLEAELSELRTARAAEALGAAASPPPETADLAGARELMEKKSIVATLRRHLGNRDAAARELKIHRRTLFEKIRRYGLRESDFLPSQTEVEATLAECRGNKSLAAERLGMSRSSFYRWWKNLRS
ncbi:MAG: helix-turn-helix domain-containing protein [bacterium]